MTQKKDQQVRVRREVVGETVSVDGVLLTPVVRMDGLVGHSRDSDAGYDYSYGFLRFKPVRALVRDARGRESTVAIADVNGVVRRNMLIAGALLAVAAIAAMIVRQAKK